MDDIEFYFNTKREYSRDFIGGLEIETCIETENYMYDSENDETIIDYNKTLYEKISDAGQTDNILPYSATEDSSISCQDDSTESACEFVTDVPYPIIDIMNKDTTVGYATLFILEVLAESCATNGAGKVSCGTHVHMSGPYTKDEYPFFNVVIRYLWVQYYQPYFIVRFYRHQERYKSRYAVLSKADAQGKYEMLNENPSKNRYEQTWHFEFRGFGEMVNQFIDVGHEYLKMLMNLFEATAKLHKRLKLHEMDQVFIEEYEEYEENINLDKTWPKLFRVRQMMQEIAPDYLGTDRRRDMNLLIGSFKSKERAVLGFNENARMANGIDYAVYQLLYCKKRRKEFSTPIPTPTDLGKRFTYKIHITWHPDLNELMRGIVQKPSTYMGIYLNEVICENVLFKDYKMNRNEKGIVIEFYKKKDSSAVGAAKYLYDTIIDGVLQNLDSDIEWRGRQVLALESLTQTIMRNIGVKRGDLNTPFPFETVMDLDQFNKHNVRAHVCYVAKWKEWNKINEELLSAESIRDTQRLKLKL
mgnify:CR=1 FL=1